jgi:hypothetical protein
VKTKEASSTVIGWLHPEQMFVGCGHATSATTLETVTVPGSTGLG